MICFPCPSCGQSLKVAGEAAGKIGKCKCGVRVRIPTPNPFEQAMEQRRAPQATPKQFDTRTAPSLIPAAPSLVPSSESNSISIAPSPNKLEKSRQRVGLLMALIAGTFIPAIVAVTAMKTIKDRVQHAEATPGRFPGDNGPSDRNVQRRPKPESLRDFVTIAKLIRTGFTEGISFRDFDEKQIKLRNAYALIDKDVLDTPIGRKVESVVSSTKKLREDWRRHIHEPEYGAWKGLFEVQMGITELKIDDLLDEWNHL